MPPRKKARMSQATSPEPASRPKTATPEIDANDEALLNDPWTDEEEIGLFKGLMRWKPTGIHKHFRLMALHAWLLENRYIHPANAHTRPAGIWTKLNTLYDLPALDAREDARQLPALENPLLQDKQERAVADEVIADIDAYSEAENKIEEEDFTLPTEDGFDEEMWKRRLPAKPEQADEDGDSEPELPEVNLADDPPVRFMPSFSIEPSEAATPSSRKGKSGGRKSAGKVEKSTRRSARQAESVADEEEKNDDEANDEEEAEDEDNEDEPDSEEESQASTPAPRSSRSKSGRGRGATRARGRGRGRK